MNASILLPPLFPPRAHIPIHVFHFLTNVAETSYGLHLHFDILIELLQALFFHFVTNVAETSYSLHLHFDILIELLQVLHLGSHPPHLLLHLPALCLSLEKPEPLAAVFNPPVNRIETFEEGRYHL